MAVGNKIRQTVGLTRRLSAVLATGVLLCSLQGVAQVSIAAGLRNVRGKVTDGHEPLHGAVVQLQNPATNIVVSYLTGPDGAYQFKRLDGNTDFNVWATFHGHRSAVRSISKFDSHMNKEVDLTIKLH